MFSKKNYKKIYIIKILKRFVTKEKEWESNENDIISHCGREVVG